MKTIDALEGAIELLQNIERGRAYAVGPGTTYTAKLRAYEQARDAHHALVAASERGRAELRALSERRRSES
jgi:hypothetical protein